VVHDENGPYWPDVKLKAIRTPASSLEILGISLLSQYLSKEFTQKLGSTQEISRGDAANGRQQSCYVSANTKTKVYLIFEFGEVTSAFYVFAGGADWNGSKYCKPSRLVSLGFKYAKWTQAGHHPPRG
jgi:hypothetical protein